MKQNALLRVTAKLLLPFILLFALYVQFHGDYGPGGGFQAGVIVAAAYVLYALIFGLGLAQKAVPGIAVRTLLAGGVLVYAGVGVADILLGGNFLDYAVMSHDPKHGHHLGILIVEIGVLLTVAGALIAIFNAFAGRDVEPDSEDEHSPKLEGRGG